MRPSRTSSLPLASPVALFPIAALVVLTSLAQAQNIGDHIGRSGQWPLLATPLGNPFESDPAVNAYAPLPGSHTEALALLGLALFWDEQLSSNNTMACATCHLPETAGLDPRPALLATNQGFGSAGVLPMDPQGNYTTGTPTSQQRQVTPLMAPTMIGAAFANQLFWDMRAGPDFPMSLPEAPLFLSNAALEAQAVGPPLSSVEMAHSGLVWGSQGSPGLLEKKLNPARVLALATFSTVPPPLQSAVTLGLTYQQAFDAVFSMPTSTFPGNFGVTRERFALAIAAYERTLVPDQAPIDTRGLTLSEDNGFNHLVSSQCFRCHSDQPFLFGNTVPALTGSGGFQFAMDATLTDNRRHFNIGFPEQPGASGEARGSFNVKTPTLRNVLLRPRWSHNGFFTDFNTLLSFYNGTLAGTNPAFPFTSGTGPGGRLTTSELADVMSFFQALTDPRLVPATPGAPLGSPFWHPDLYSERHPFGSTESPLHPGTPPPGGLTPDLILHVPLLSADSNFNIGLRDAPANATLGVIGLSPGGLPAAPVPPLMLNPAGLIVLNLRVIPATGTVTDAASFATLHFPPLGSIPGGFVVSVQGVVLDPVSGQFAWSNAGQLTVQP